MKLCFIDMILHTSTKDFDIKQPPLFGMGSSGGLWLNTHALLKWPATSATDIPLICTVFVILLNNSVSTKSY